MKKSVIASVKRISAFFASTVMAAAASVCAAGMTASADDITDGVKQISASIELRNVEGAAGGTAVVQVIPTSGNQCSSYDFLLEYDSRLELEVEDVAGANAYQIFEEDGRKYVSLVGFTSGVYEDGVPMATLNFRLPADATEDEEFDVSMAKVTSFASQSSNLEVEVPSCAEVSAVTSECANGLKTYQEFAKNGMLVGSSVGLRGDVNQDKKTNVRDAAAIASYLAGKGRNSSIDERGLFLGDVDDNGNMNVRDAAKIAKYVAHGSVSWD